MDEYKGRLTKDGIRVHQPEDFAGMHRAGALAAKILDDIAPFVQVGTTTAAVHNAITDMVNAVGATSATIGYRGYRHASCNSENDVASHRIPGTNTHTEGT